MFRTAVLTTGICAALGLAGFAYSDAVPAQESGQGAGEARNVILFIGDGMGDSEITIARNYELGAAGTFAMDTLPMTGDMTTYSVQEEDPDTPDYVPDSAATGTAWATGQKTSNNRVSTTPGTDEDLTTILELAQRAGMRTGNVSTAELTDATPAVLVSKVANRGCMGPEDMDEDCPQDKKSEGGPGSIAEQSVDHGVDVLMGGARAIYEQQIDGGPDEGMTVMESAEKQGYNVVYDEAEMQAASAGQPVLGLFADENLETVWTGEPARREFDVDSEPQVCEEDNAPDGQPTLEAMTEKAIELLDNDSGFFLQVESASIDKQDHISAPCEQIGETIDFDNAIKIGLDYAAQNPDTLVIVTGDHGHTSQIIPGPESRYHSDDYTYNPPGESALLKTADDTSMLVTYATERFRDEAGEIVNEEGSHTHTGTQIRLAAQGPNSESVLGLHDQTEVFSIMTEALGLNAGTTTAPTATPETGGTLLEGTAGTIAAIIGTGLLFGAAGLLAGYRLLRRSP